MSELARTKVPEQIQRRRTELEALCRKYGVAKLELFGSAATDKFDEDSSDFDFLIEFFPEQDLGPWMKYFFELEQELKELFGREVDLIFGSNIRNPFLKQSIDATRTLLYAA